MEIRRREYESVEIICCASVRIRGHATLFRLQRVSRNAGDADLEISVVADNLHQVLYPSLGKRQYTSATMGASRAFRVDRQR